MLGLGYERICAAVSVPDRDEPQPDWYPAQISFDEAMRIYTARLALIEAAAKQAAKLPILVESAKQCEGIDTL
jgi:hypothetical protein